MTRAGARGRKKERSSRDLLFIMHFDFLTAAGLFASVARRQALDPDFPMNMNSSTWAFALGFNQLTGEIPAKIGQMTSLQRLVLFVNQLTGAIPTELSQLNNLYYLQAHSAPRRQHRRLDGHRSPPRATRSRHSASSPSARTRTTCSPVEDESATPQAFALRGNAPNPVRRVTTIRYDFAASDDGAACGLRRTGPPRGDACRQVIVYRSRDVSPKRLYYERFRRLR